MISHDMMRIGSPFSLSHLGRVGLSPHTDVVGKNRIHPVLAPEARALELETSASAQRSVSLHKRIGVQGRHMSFEKLL